MNFKRIGIISLLAITAIIVLVLIFPQSPEQLLSPLSLTDLGIFTPPKTQHLIYGFLPYWNFKYALNLNYRLLTHLAVFGVSFDEEGNIMTREENYAEPGWRALNSENFDLIKKQALISKTKLILVLRGFDNDVTDALMTDQAARDNFINQTTSLIKTYGFQGINIDFEYLGDPGDTNRRLFTDLIAQLSQAVKALDPTFHISIDVYAESIDGDRIWDLAGLAPYVDNFVVMFYDFYRSTSPNAGPVAPLYGGGTLWKSDITSLLARYTKILQPSKILFGVPFYGYEWRTKSADHLSLVYPKTGSLATYSRIKTILNEKNPEIFWDDAALSPWLTYLDNGKIMQVYYEDVLSLGLKFDLINQHQLAGTAIWALGYEGSHSDFWTLIKSKLN